MDVDDGLAFQPDTLRVQEISVDQEYGGIRVKVMALLGSARVHTQADIGFGDRLVSGGEEATLPTLLGHPAARLRVYGPEATIAEKLEAIVRFGEANSRYKDYFDLHLLATERRFDGEALQEQIRATFARRATTLPDDVPPGLREEFGEDVDRQRQWGAFLRRSGADVAPEFFSDVVAVVRSFTLSPMLAARRDEAFQKSWKPGGPWIQCNVG